MSDEQPRGIVPYDLARDVTAHAMGVLARQIEADAKAYSPLRVGLSAAEQRAHRARVEEAARQRQREADSAHEAATADWLGLCALLADNRPALAALDVHQPEGNPYRGIATCTECVEGDGDDTVAIEWPCGTFAAMKAAADA